MENTICNENNNERAYLIIWVDEDRQSGQYGIRVSEIWSDSRENALKTFYKSQTFLQCIRVINCFTKEGNN